MAKKAIDELIEKRIGEVRIDSLDISFGELISLHDEKEFIISPAYQRLFRWSLEQRSRLIESILLKLPIPQIFVVENEDSTLELIDGLQRIIAVIHFLQPEKLDAPPLKLIGCDIVPELNGLFAEELPLSLRLRLKRAAVRMVIIKKQSKTELRYEMFEATQHRWIRVVGARNPKLQC